MVKLKNIKKQGVNITCDAYIEDCVEPVSVVFNIVEKSVQNISLPKGYEWCTSHIAHAKRALERMEETGDIKENWNIYWY